MKDDRIYLRHILECLDAIGSYNSDGGLSFQQDRKTAKATIRELQELAESTQRLSDSVRQLHPEVPWAQIGGFRNVLVHDYLGLNPARIWDVVERDLPALKAAVEDILGRLGQA